MIKPAHAKSITRNQRGRTPTFPRKRGKSKKSVMPFIAIGAVIVVIVLVIFVTIAKRSVGVNSDAAHIQAMHIIKSFPDYERYSIYYEKLVEKSHESSFRAAYVQNPNQYSVQDKGWLYLSYLTNDMAERAKRDGNENVAMTCYIYAQGARAKVPNK